MLSQASHLVMKLTLSNKGANMHSPIDSTMPSSLDTQQKLMSTRHGSSLRIISTITSKRTNCGKFSDTLSVPCCNMAMAKIMESWSWELQRRSTRAAKALREGSACRQTEMTQGDGPSMPAPVGSASVMTRVKTDHASKRRPHKQACKP